MFLTQQIHGSVGEKSPTHTYESEGEEDSSSSSVITSGAQTPPSRLGDNISIKSHTPSLSIKSEHCNNNKSMLSNNSIPTSSFLGTHQTTPTSNSPMIVGHHNHHLLYHHTQHPNDWYHSPAPPATDPMNHLNHFSHHHHLVHHGATTAY